VEYHKVHNITPASTQKSIEDILGTAYEADYVTVPKVAERERPYLSPEAIRSRIADLQKRMKEAAKRLEFEEASLLRDEIKALEAKELESQA